MVSYYEAQIGQMPTPYYSQPATSSNKRKLGMTVAGGLIGMNAYYLPVNKDVYVQRGFDMTRDEANSQVRTLKQIAKNIEKQSMTTEDKMFLQQLGLPEDVTAITNHCKSLEEKVTNPASVKQIKDKYIKAFDTNNKKTHLMDAVCSDAYRAVKRNKFWWGVGIGSGIGLALGLMGSRD